MAALSVAPSTTDLRERRGRLNEVRQWARKNGYSVSGRGRVSAEVLAAFENTRTDPRAHPETAQ